MAYSSRVSLHKLEVFDAVVQHGGITRAAEHLGVAQPVVTAHMRTLQERLDVELFYREGRGLELTEAGRTAHAWAVDVLRRTRQLLRDLERLSDGLQGTITMGTSMSIGSYRLPPLLGRFLRERPAVEIQLDVSDAAHALSATEEGHNDFAVVVIESPPTNPALTTELIGHEDLVIVTAPDGSALDREVTIEELAKLPFVEAQRGSLRRTFTDRELARVGLGQRQVLMELGHPEAMKKLVASGHGVCCLFRSAVQDDIEKGQLQQLKVRDLEMSGPLYLVYRRDKLFSAVQRDFLGALRSYLADGGDEPSLDGPQ
jgi:LysR family transcriptional regulator, low CO2-responsive transcriptional regulator